MLVVVLLLVLVLVLVVLVLVLVLLLFWFYLEFVHERMLKHAVNYWLQGSIYGQNFPAFAPNPSEDHPELVEACRVATKV